MKNKEIRCPNCGAVETLIYQNIEGIYPHKVLQSGRISEKIVKRKNSLQKNQEKRGLLMCEKCNTYWIDMGIKGSFKIKSGKIVFQEVDKQQQGE